MYRDCGEMNVYPNGGLVAHGEPHWGKMAFSRLILQTSLYGQAYPGLPEGLDTCLVRSTRGLTSGAGKSLIYLSLWSGPSTDQSSSCTTSWLHFPLSIKRNINDTIKPRAS